MCKLYLFSMIILSILTISLFIDHGFFIQITQFKRFESIHKNKDVVGERVRYPAFNRDSLSFKLEKQMSIQEFINLYQINEAAIQSQLPEAGLIADKDYIITLQ